MALYLLEPTDPDDDTTPAMIVRARNGDHARILARALAAADPEEAGDGPEHERPQYISDPPADETAAVTDGGEASDWLDPDRTSCKRLSELGPDGVLATF